MLILLHTLFPTLVPGSARLSSVPLVTNVKRITSPLRLVADPCNGKTWPQLQEVLDKLPVFTVANSDGQPQTYDVGEQKNIAIFYADVEVAKQEYAKAQDQFPGLGYDIIPVGLGSAYKLSCDGKGIIVPGLADLRAAGAPEDFDQPMGQELPLFACVQLKREGQTPLFMSSADCTTAIAEATEGTDKTLPINAILSLQSVVEELAGLDDPTSGEFSLQPPLASRQHVEGYLGQGVYIRKVEDGEEA